MNTFVTADLHLGHENMTKFSKDGKKLRPYNTVEEMNKALIDNWNSVVKDDDLVYVLGDFTVNKKWIYLAQELAGRKILVKGNHDIGELAEYAEYFEDVVACKVLANAILTHIPIHPGQLERFKHNIHGHLHDGFVHVGTHTRVVDGRYTCVSVERTEFKPILLRNILDGLK